MKRRIIGSLILLTILIPTTAITKVTITGDALVQENRTNILKVIGNATVTKGNSILQADKIIYDKKNKKLNASGNVKYLLKDQISIEADNLFLDDNGNIKSTDARYTNCIVDSEKVRTWEISAQKIDRDTTEKRINLTNATLKIYDYPIYYWPHLSTYEQSVKKARGWMTPKGGTSTTLGAYISNEYYIPLNNAVLSFIPTYSTKGGETIQTIYKHNQLNTSLNANAAITRSKQDEKFAYVFIDYQKVLPNSGWKIGSTLEYSTDEKYTKEYTFLKETAKDYFKTSLYAEKQSRNGFLNLSSAKYQDIRIKKVKNNYIFPKVQYDFQTFSKSLNSFIQNKTVLRSMQVVDSGKQSVISNTLQISSPQYLDNGLVLTPELGLRTDILHYENKDTTKPDENIYISGTEKKVLPSINLLLSYPILIKKGIQKHLLEPIAGLYSTKEYIQNPHVKNFDSSDFDVNESNIFTSNRYAGIDKINTGNRLAYGLRLRSWLEHNTYLQGFLGQSISISDNKRYSDYIGNFLLEKNNFNMASNFEIDSEAFTLRKLDVRSNFIYGKSRFGVGLTETKPEDESQLDPLKQIKIDIDHAFNKNWIVSVKNIANYKKNSGPVKQSLAIKYITDCNCITTKFAYAKDFSIDAKTPEEALTIQVMFNISGENTDLTNSSFESK